MNTLRWLLTPSTKITDKEELPKAQGLLILLVSFIIICFGGLFGSPGSISRALLYGLPFLCISYVLAKTRMYKTGGILAIFATFFIVAVIVIRIDLEGKFSYLSLSWITITVFMATIFLKFRYVLVITAIQLLFSIGLFRLTSNISTPVFISWSVLNGFFIIINLSTRWIIEKQHRLLIEQNNILEKMVDKRTTTLAEALEEKEELLKELYHRTKNNMQVISSILKLQAAGSDNKEVKTALNETHSRIISMSLVHDRLYKSDDLRVISLKDYLHDLIDEIYGLYAINPGEIGLLTELVEVKAAIESAIPLGVVMHELITNIFKHAYQKGSTLIIDIKSAIEDNGMLVITVADNGKGLSKQIDPETCTSLGISLSQSIIKHQLHGSISFVSTTEGLTVTVSVPADNEVSSIYTHSNH